MQHADKGGGTRDVMGLQEEIGTAPTDSRLFRVRKHGRVSLFLDLARVIDE